MLLHHASVEPQNLKFRCRREANVGRRLGIQPRGHTSSLDSARLGPAPARVNGHWSTAAPLGGGDCHDHTRPWVSWYAAMIRHQSSLLLMGRRK